MIYREPLAPGFIKMSGKTTDLDPGMKANTLFSLLTKPCFSLIWLYIVCFFCIIYIEGQFD